MNTNVKKKETGKKVTAMIKLNILAGKATPSPPIGPALGQRGLNIMEFCKAFNAATQSEEPGCVIPVVITAYADKTFTFIMKSPTATYFIKKYAEPSIKSGSKNPGKGEFVAKITRAKLMEIAAKKIADSNANDLEKMCKTLEGTAYSMGVEVIN